MRGPHFSASLLARRVRVRSKPGLGISFSIPLLPRSLRPVRLNQCSLCICRSHSFLPFKRCALLSAAAGPPPLCTCLSELELKGTSAPSVLRPASTPLPQHFSSHCIPTAQDVCPQLRGCPAFQVPSSRKGLLSWWPPPAPPLKSPRPWWERIGPIFQPRAAELSQADC